MQKLNFPTYNIRMRILKDAQQVFDVVRKKWVVLTPEEWVRQNLIHFLHHEKKIPFSLMSIEKKMLLNGMTRRTDLVVFNRDMKPVLIGECKAPDIKLTQTAMDQVARYNITLRVPILLISNGLQHFCCRIDVQNKSYSFLTDIPTFDALK